MKVRSIRRHLLVTQALLLSVLLCMFAAGLYQYVRHVLHSNLDKKLSHDAFAMTQLVEFEGWQETDGVRSRRIEIETGDTLLPIYEQKGNGYVIMDPEGKVVANSPHAMDKLLKRKKDSGRAEDGVRYLKIHFLPRKAPRDDDEWTLLVHNDTEGIQSTLRAIVLGSIFCGGVIIVLSLIVCRWSIRREIAPVNRMAEEVAMVEADDLSYRVECSHLPEELKPIGVKINDLLDRVEAAFTREKRFSASAAHELRTPLAELKAILQVGRKIGEGSAPKMFEDGEEVVQRMESLLGALLTLMDKKRELQVLKWKDVRLADLVHNRINELLDDEARERFAVEVDSSIVIRADEGLLTRVLDNLLKNAECYGDPGSLILVASTVDGNFASFSVSNKCESLDEKDLSEMEEPFWRKNEARTSGENLGLGLSLVRKYCQVMGWQLTIGGELPEVKITISGIKLHE